MQAKGMNSSKQVNEIRVLGGMKALTSNHRHETLIITFCRSKGAVEKRENSMPLSVLARNYYARERYQGAISTFFEQSSTPPTYLPLTSFIFCCFLFTNRFTVRRVEVAQELGRDFEFIHDKRQITSFLSSRCWANSDDQGSSP